MSKTLLKYFISVVIFAVVIITFITATTYKQLAVAILLYPIFIVFVYKMLSESPKSLKARSSVAKPHFLHTVSQSEKAESSTKEDVSISDIDKRVFLKLIGGSGVLFFVFSLLSKKTENMFFRNLTGETSTFLPQNIGSQTQPTQNKPLDGYAITEIDDGTVSFYGFTDRKGAWYVMRLDGEGGSFRYAKGSNNFLNNWDNRKNLKYGYFSEVFSN